jgi:hypothetical protein
VATPLRARWARWHVVTARSPHTGRRGGAVAEEPVMASHRQGVADELTGTLGTASGNRSEGGAHRGRRSTVRWGWRLGAAARSSVLTGGRVGGDSG